MKKLLSLILLTCLVLAGCSNSKPAATPPGENNQTSGGSQTENNQNTEGNGKQELTKITISEFRGVPWASTYIADLLGYFEEEGLDAEFIIYKDGPIAFQGMHAGDSDFCLLSAEPVMTAYDEGMESYLLLSNTNNRCYAFAGSPEVKSVEDLKGKTVFAGMPGSAPYSFVLSMLKSAGLSESDVSFVNLEYGASILALGEGQVDGIFFDIYNKKALMETVPEANILLNCTDPATHEKLYGSQFCQTSIVTCTKKFAQENPETVQKFVNASVKAFAWMSEHTAAEWAELLSPMFEGMTEEELATKLDVLKSSFSETGEIIPEGYSTMESFCLDQGLISKSIPYEDIVASQFMNTALGK